MYPTAACAQHNGPQHNTIFQSSQLEGALSLCSSGGGWSDVYSAKLNAFNPDPSKEVAIKFFRRNGKPQYVIDAWIANELRIWGIVHLADHQNLAPFLGVITSYGHTNFQRYISPWPVCDHYRNKDLDMFVRSKDLVQRLNLLKGVISGLAHMHENSIVHGDLKASNVLVDDFGIAKLCDFGSSRIVCSCVHHTYCPRANGLDKPCSCSQGCPCINGRGNPCTCNQDEPCINRTSNPCTCNIENPSGTEIWSSPERLEDEEDRCTRESDVWAFGCLSLEVQFDMKPYRGDAFTAQFSIIDELPPAVEEDVDLKGRIANRVWSIMQKCWEFDCVCRPSANDLLSEFMNIQENDVDEVNLEESSCIY